MLAFCFRRQGNKRGECQNTTITRRTLSKRQNTCTAGVCGWTVGLGPTIAHGRHGLAVLLVSHPPGGVSHANARGEILDDAARSFGEKKKRKWSTRTSSKYGVGVDTTAQNIMAPWTLASLTRSTLWIIRAIYLSTRAVVTFHAASSFPRYPENAFLPHGHSTGLQIAEKAETLRYLSGFLTRKHNHARAPTHI